jgi:DNA polymerase III epsilon subunit-like protein
VQRHYGTCPQCGNPEVWRDTLVQWGQCGACQETEDLAQRAEDRAAAVQWAQETLADPGAVVLDTETTDLYGEMIEIAVLTMRGAVLLDTLVCPTGGLGPISPAATAVHGLTMVEVADAPTFAQLAGQVAALLARASRIVAWNSAFDYFTLQRTCALAQVEDFAQATATRWTCAMEWYAQWWGEWSEYHGDYRWQPLGGGHRAREDCLVVLARLRAMTGGEAETS